MDEYVIAPALPPYGPAPHGPGPALPSLRLRGAGGPLPFDDAYVIVKDAVAPGARIRIWKGYVVFRKGEDSAIARWHGGDTPPPDPETDLTGTWKFVAGTGRLGKISGGGTFNAREAGPGQFTFEWKGSFELGRPAGIGRSARRFRGAPA